MTAARICSQCGTELPGDTLQGLCPKCLGQVVFGLTAEAPTTVSVSEKPGDRIGRYKLLQEIGEGGCGVVYMAEQEEPVRRRVALKIIKLGMDTKSVIARFEAERQALALMDHPNIAKVLDAGATETGRPFFVMELVRGVKITDFCDQNNLAARERLNLFIQVCHAIQHAHQKGVIHRDIKPSNILVTLHDGEPVPKVIDFGIAKATQQRLTDKTLFTAFEQFIGTPAYMSPEQAEMSGLDIDTRSDIYSLGVLLYELLTGKTPFDPKTLAAAGLDEMRRIIREQEPVRPSTRLSTMLDAERTDVAKRRQSDLPKLIHFLRGDLDWIVMKCLEKNRSRRYEAANSVALDIQHHLQNEPVTARPPSAAYRLEKFFRRNRVMVIAGGAVAVALVLGLVTSTWLAIRAERLRVRAEANEDKAQQAQANEAKQRQRAENQELAARQQVYAADMNLAQQALAVNNLGRAEALLNRHRPQAGSPDLRGWEWRYLWQQCRSEALFTLCRKSNSITSLTVSSDGTWLAIEEAGQLGISIWNVRTRQEIARLPGELPIRAVFSPQVPLLAVPFATNPSSAGPQNGVRFWDAATQQIAGEVPLDSRCLGLGFSVDGQTLVTVTTNHLELWRVPGGSQVASHPLLTALRGTLFAVAPDLSLVAYESFPNWRSRRVVVADVETGKERWSTNFSDQELTALAVSPDKKILATSSRSTEAVIRLWDTATGKLLGSLAGHGGYVLHLVYWPDSRRLASAAADQTIRIWDLTNLEHVPAPRILHGHKREVTRLALLSDGTTLISGGRDGEVCLWNTTASVQNGSYLTFTNISYWLFAADSQSIVVEEDNRWVWRKGAGYRHKEPLAGMGRAISPNFQWTAEGSTNGVIRVWDLTQPTEERQFKVGTGPVSPDVFITHENKLLVHRQNETVSRELDLATGQEIRSWPKPGTDSVFVDVCFKNERWCLVLDGNRRSLYQGFQTNIQLKKLELNIRNVLDMAVSPDGNLIAVASALGYAQVWNTATLQEVGTFSGLLQDAYSLIFSPDGKRVAVFSGGRETVKLWDVASQRELLTLEGEGWRFPCSAFSPDGNVIGAISWPGSKLHLWRAPSWSEIETTEQRETNQTPAR
jgi:eukaryotic-like serine/threonine-protein kinase